MLGHQVEISAIRWISVAIWLGAMPCGLMTLEIAQAEESPQHRAKELFKQSAERYREGRFQEALDLLTEAYTLDPNPVLLYNMARAHESLGDARRAADTYRRYLDADPKAKDRGAIEQRIETLERQLQEREKLQRDASRQPKTRVRVVRAPPARQPNPVPWIIAGVGVAGLGVGLGFGVAAQAAHNDAVDETTGRRAGELQARAERFSIVANVAFGVGGAAAIGGLIWGIVDVTSAEDDAQVGILLLPGGGALTCAF
jgi:tetratricopeptide (TPR) repeat protein